MIVDAFIYHNEEEILEIRLATLYSTVDRFVLVEGNRTHAGQPKVPLFWQNMDRFERYIDKVTHVIVDEWPAPTGNTYEDAWARERHQRDAILHGLQDCTDNDIIIIGDADEIAHPDIVAAYKVSDGLVRLKQRMFYYFLNCENKEGWDWQKIAPYSLVRERTPCGIRYPPAGEVPLIEGAGWHFSFCGDAEHVRTKLRDYSHQEFNRAEVLEGVEDAIREGRDIFGRDLKYEFVEIDEDYPRYVKDRRLDFHNSGLIKDIYLPSLPIGTRTASDFSSRHWTVTAEVSTKDRYTTTLPMCLSAIVNQTRLPDRLKVYDDGEQKNLFELAPFNGLLRLAQDKGIDVEILSTPRMGQVTNHQHCLDVATTDFIWRVDDDEIPEPSCLETLLNTIRDHERGGSAAEIGAVGGLVHHPGAVNPLPSTLTGSLADIDRGNIQWYSWNSGPRETEHLYSSFIFQVDAARKAGGYPQGLSPIGHREESWLTSKIQRAGYKLLVTPHTVTWHLRESTGGIRSYSNSGLWEHDEQLWKQYLNTIGRVASDTKLIVCDYGLGDHLALRGVWPDLVRKFPDRKWTLALCFPEVFKDVPNVTIISIADSKLLVGARYDDYSLYRWCWDCDWKGSIVDAMKEFYGR